MIKVNPIKEKLASGQPVIGIWSLISSPALVEVLAMSGLDFVILDMEHGIYGVDALDSCVRACEGAGASPLVRVPGLNAAAIQWALDIGAHGVIVPQVSGYDQVVEAVKMSKFAPNGTRGYNPFTRAGEYGGSNEKLSNLFGLSAVIVETENSLQELEKICLLPDLDMIYIGVYDLSIALNCDGNTDHPRITKILENSIRTIRASGKAAGMIVRNADEIKKGLALGANVLVYGVDTMLIRKSITDTVETFHKSI